ncbi:MAG TPA: response regulator transcription factor [Candidatus Acidoferrales bacterium]|jgi:DNA-binding response OmpR family regulator|nr:response regulator transcription factor [Candidatus Acidoferrales bacterium]
MEKILIVEDDRATRKALQQLFEFEGYTAEVAPDGAQGLAAFRASRPDFVILDLRMPLVGGQDVCRLIRKESEEVPILILSGSAAEVDRVLLLELGADDYVTKPFSPKELLARVRAVLRRSRRPPAVEQLHFSDVSVDFLKMEVVRAGRQISLTPQEFKLLKYFSQNQERVLSRDQLLSDVWGYNSYPSTRTVDSHILTLRQKLEKDPANPVHFLTVHNVGYKFQPMIVLARGTS